MTPQEYERHDALGLAALVRAGAVSAEELLAAAAARIAAGNAALNAVILDCLDFAQAELAARRAAGCEREGVFCGVPVLVKDLLNDVAGLTTWHGSRLLKGRPPADHDSCFIHRLRATGALIVGKTNTPELGITPFTEPELCGPTRNPWDLSRTPGGSSGGSAAAVAAGFVPLATGSDGGGSIRIPASCCGLFGLKPTRGRVPTGPDLGSVLSGFAIDHGLTRSVRDSAALLDAVAGQDPGPPFAAPAQARPFLDEVGTEPGRLRIGVDTTPWLGGQLDADGREAVERSVALLRSLGHQVDEVKLPLEREPFALAFLTVLAAHVRSQIEDIGRQLRRRPRRADHELATWTLALLGRSFRADEFLDAERVLQLAARRIGAWFESIDVLLSPTLGHLPPPIGALQPTAFERAQLRLLSAVGSPWLVRALGVHRRMVEQVFSFIPYTAVFNATGQPAMSVPLHWTAGGLPVGVHFAARFGDEATLFRLAGQLERAQPWFHRRPPPLSLGAPTAAAA
jgi:amidase